MNPPYTMSRKKKKKWSKSTIVLNVKGKIRFLDNNTEYQYDLRDRQILLEQAIKCTIN